MGGTESVAPLTIIKVHVARIDRAGAETQEENTVFGILSIELGHSDVLRSLNDRV